MPVIKFINAETKKVEKEIEVPAGANLRRAAMKAGVQLYPFPHNIVNCHGLSQCGSCRVLLAKGKENASRVNLFEKLRMMFSMARIGHEDNMRLACQTRVNGDMDVVTKPPMNLFGENFFS